MIANRRPARHSDSKSFTWWLDCGGFDASAGTRRSARRLLHRATLLVAALLALNCPSEVLAEEAKSVALTIDYGDGVEKRFLGVPWEDGTTVLDVLEFAAKHPRGIKFEYRGRSATGFLTKIDDLANEGRGRNWLFYLNGKIGERSFAVQELKAGDAVLWKFQKGQ